MDELIRRQDAINCCFWGDGCFRNMHDAVEDIRQLPSAQPNVPDINVGDMISRQDAIDAFMDEVESYGLMDDDGNVESGAKDSDVIEMLKNLPPANPWISCSERLPKDSGDYLVCPSDAVLEDYSNFSEVMIMPYDADCEAFGWWTERYDPISLGYVDSDFNEFEVLAWMPLPDPYKEEENV